LNRPKQEYRVGVGTSTMITIFSVLCVATLALLALSGARGDAALAGRAVAMSEAYYEASDRAQRVLAQLDEMVQNAAASGREAFEAALSGREVDGIPLEFGGETVSFTVDAGGGRVLSVAVRLNETKPHCTIVRYALIGGELWMGEDQNLNLFS
jgi:hypothetical protein